MGKLQWLPGWPMIIDHDQKQHNHHCHHHDHDQKRPGWHACPRDPGTLRLLTVSRLFARIYTQWSAWWRWLSRWGWLSRFLMIIKMLSSSWLSKWYLPHDYQDDIFIMIIMIMAMIFLMLRWKIPTWKWQWWATRPAVGSPSPVLRFFSSLWKVKVKVYVKEKVHVCIHTKMRTVRGSPSTILRFFSFLLA